MLGSDAQELHASVGTDDSKVEGEGSPRERRSSGVFPHAQAQRAERLRIPRPTCYGRKNVARPTEGFTDGNVTDARGVNMSIDSAVFYSCVFETGK